MLLSTKDIEVLKLICWCKNVPVPVRMKLCSFYGLDELDVFEYTGLTYRSKDGKNIRPRPAAYRLLSDAGINFKSDLKPQTKEKVLERRNIASQILFTFYRAGVSVFEDKLDKVYNTPVYIASFAARQSDACNPFGSTRFYGIFRTAQEAFLVLYADDTGVYYQKELTLFHSLTEATGILNTAIIIMGKSTQGIAAQVLREQKNNRRKTKYNTDSFQEIFEMTTLPTHFIPIGDSGAQIIRFLIYPDYREAIAKAILKSSYRSPYPNLTDTDTIHHKEPYNPAVVAIDMDVGRIDRAIAGARNIGYEKIAIYALPEQVNFLKSRYSAVEAADVMTINLDNIKNVINHSISLYQPPSDLYVTNEGRYFDVSDFSAYRKAGRQV